MKSITAIGIALVIIGGAALAYSGFSYTTTEELIRIGPLKATAEKTHSVNLPPAVGWLLIGGGACMLAFVLMSKKP